MHLFISLEYSELSPLCSNSESPITDCQLLAYIEEVEESFDENLFDNPVKTIFLEHYFSHVHSKEFHCITAFMPSNRIC
jgi:hypothetical protein